MKKMLSMLLCAALLLALCAAAAAETQRSALEAFQALSQGEPAPTAPDADGEALLDQVMAGAYADSADGAQLQALSSVSAGDIAAYAAARNLNVAQVRNAYYKALANVLKAEMQANPASEEKYRNIQAILALFLQPDFNPENDDARAGIRSGMTPDAARTIAETYGLPVAFVEFVIMNRDWDDDDWTNDDDWMDDFNWDDLVAETFGAITLGSKDAAGETTIADLQQMLIDLGYLNGKADGIFGARTQSALIEFELANGLAVTGNYTANDYRRLTGGQSVARWEYGGDFYDSRDYDTTDFDGVDTPDAPDTPDTPDVPDTPDTPDAPDTPDTPDIPDTPDTPDSD